MGEMTARPERRRPASGRLLIAASVVAVLVVAAVVIVVTQTAPVVPSVAAADPVYPPTTLADEPPPAVVTTTTDSVPEEPAAVEPEADSPPAPVALPAPKPGPPTWPSTGAQDMTDGSGVTIFDGPNRTARRTLPTPYGPLRSHPAFRVIGGSRDWLQVQLPTRPNGSTGWIRAADVTTFTTNVSIDVDVAARWVTVYDKNRVVLSEPVVVGTSSTPSPLGDFYITDLVPNPGAGFGPYAFGLSAHSNVLDQFAGGDGQVAIHGTNQPQLMGTAASHGCIRMRNPTIAQLQKLVTIGVPVRIHDG